MKVYFSLLLLILLACDNKKKFLIQVPEQTRITSEWILTELEEKAKEDPDNEWLLNQQLYFCEQMNWPLRCERVLIRARSRWGLSEQLIDQFVAFYVQQNSYGQLESILNGAMDTRTRLEARIQIGLSKSPPDLQALDRYLEQHTDAQAILLGIQGYVIVQDTVQALTFIDKLMTQHPDHKNLVRYYPVLAAKGKHDQAIFILKNGLADQPDNEQLRFDLAINLYQLSMRDTAFAHMRRLNSNESNRQLHDWFKTVNALDSALFYAERVDPSATSPDLLLSMAEILEVSGRITRSLHYYESVLAMDTTDLEMRQRVEIVRRKVAYLRQNREQKVNPPPPKIERKTLGN